jgi:hypothetical protein
MRILKLLRLPALALALALAACSQTAAPVPTTVPAATQAPVATAAPTAAPTTAPATTEAPTVAPTVALTEAPAPTAAPAGVLPAPLLFINDENEIARMEVDGTTVTTLTSEPDLIIDFAVSPADGALAYLTIDADGQGTTLVRANAEGGERAELARGIIRGVTVAADGSVQAGVVGDAAGADGTGLQLGAWNFPSDDSAPTQLAAASEPTQAADGTMNPGAHYQPLAWSPDGSKLLMRLTMNFGPDAPAGDIGSTGLALYDVGAIQARDLLPLGAEPLCIDPAWARGSDAIVCANAAAIGPPTPALWRLDLANDSQETIIPAAEPLVVTFSPHDTPEGLYVLAGSYVESGLSLMPQRITPDNVTIDQLPLPIEAGHDGGLWAPDDHAAPVGRPTATANRIIVWQPLGEGATVELMTGSIGKLEWAAE